MSWRFGEMAGLGDLFWPASSGATPIDRAALARATLLSAAAISLAAIVVVRTHLQRHRNRRSHPDGATNFVRADSLILGEAILLDSPASEGSRRITAALQSVTRRNIVVISDKALGIHSGKPIRATQTTDSAALRFQSTVQDVRIQGEVTTLYLAPPEWVERIQRREYFRVPIDTPAMVHAAESSRDPVEMIRCRVDDLSAGGFSAAVPLPIAAGSRIRVRMPMPAFLGCSFDARVIDCAPTRDRDPLRIRCEFLYLSEETRNLLVNYCYQIQRESMRSRLPA